MKQVKIVLRVCVLAGVVAFAIWAKKSGFFEAILSAVKSLGFWAPPAFLGIYILSCLLFFPSVVLTLASGALFPFPLAVFLCLLGNSLGSVMALLIGRYGLRAWVRKKSEKNAQFQLLDEAVRKEGWKIAVLARLTPIFPFSIGNYFFGATPIRAWLYGMTAFVGTIPSASVYAWAGHLTGGQAAGREKSPLEWGLLAVGILATLILSWYLKQFFEKLRRK
ncbi:MAG TPA: hypothetical protein DIS66_04490 [Candidatus Omnitrophica bacterium]|nr:hypothetical protein [Candidatus Omnitrophota bacterium]